VFVFPVSRLMQFERDFENKYTFHGKQVSDIPFMSLTSNVSKQKMSQK